MCGIVGFVGKPKSNPVPSSRGDWFEEALVCDVLRGIRRPSGPLTTSVPAHTRG
jgi:hypothetical protein